MVIETWADVWTVVISILLLVGALTCFVVSLLWGAETYVYDEDDENDYK